MCEIGVRSFQDRTAKRQAKSQREQAYMSNGGFGLSGREGLALPGRLEFKDKKNKEKKEKRRRSSKTIVKIQKGTGIRTTEDPQWKLRAIALK